MTVPTGFLAGFRILGVLNFRYAGSPFRLARSSQSQFSRLVTGDLRPRSQPMQSSPPLESVSPAPPARHGHPFVRARSSRTKRRSSTRCSSRSRRTSSTTSVWQELHDAAVRHDRVSELAFAYESVSQGRKLKTFLPPVQAELYFRAAAFFGEVLGDEFGATTYLEKALTAWPAHTGAFERIDAQLTRVDDNKKLADLCVHTAHAPLEGRSSRCSSSEPRSSTSARTSRTRRSRRTRTSSSSTRPTSRCATRSRRAT